MGIPRSHVSPPQPWRWYSVALVQSNNLRQHWSRSLLPVPITKQDPNHCLNQRPPSLVTHICLRARSSEMIKEGWHSTRWRHGKYQVVIAIPIDTQQTSKFNEPVSVNNLMSCYFDIVCAFSAKLSGLYSLSTQTSCRKISKSRRHEIRVLRFLIALKFDRQFGSNTAKMLSYFRAIRPLWHLISRLRDSARFGAKTSYRLVNRGPGNYYTQCRWYLAVGLRLTVTKRYHTE